MYPLTLPDFEAYNSETNEFVSIKGKTYKLEHSLISISKWESKWHRPFLSPTDGPRTPAETLDYVRCMCINDEIPESVLPYISRDEMDKIMKYINDPMTATTFSKRRKQRAARNSSTFVTSEVLYWQMSMFSIPYKCEQWHLNRLLTLLRVCEEKGQTPQKMSERDILRQYASANAARRKPRRR